MLSSFLRTKCTVQEKTTEAGHLGDSVTWADGDSYWCRRVSVDVATRNAYMQQGTVVTDKFFFSGTLELQFGQHRIVHDSKTFELVESAQHLDNTTIVLARQI